MYELWPEGCKLRVTDVICLRFTCPILTRTYRVLDSIVQEIKEPGGIFATFDAALQVFGGLDSETILDNWLYLAKKKLRL